MCFAAAAVVLVADPDRTAPPGCVGAVAECGSFVVLPAAYVRGLARPRALPRRVAGQHLPLFSLMFGCPAVPDTPQQRAEKKKKKKRKREKKRKKRKQKRAARGRAEDEHDPDLDSDATPGSVEPPRPRGGAVPGPDSDLPPHLTAPAPETAAALVAAWGSDSGTDSEGEYVRGSSGHWEASASHALRLWRREMRAEQRAAAEHSRCVSTSGEPGGRL